MELIQILFKFLVGHALADYVFQTEIMAKLKNWNNKPDHIPMYQKYVPCWHYWMGSHALIHGGAVYVITGSVLFGIIETILHFGIDCAKCAGWTDPNKDQALHLLCKLAYIPFLI